MQNPPDFFRKTLNEFRAADDLLSKQLKLADDTASAQQIETTNRAEHAESIATGYLRSIEGIDSVSADFPDTNISSKVDNDIATLKNLATSAAKDKKELNQINRGIAILKAELKEALSQEENERKAAERKRRLELEELERNRQQALLKEKADRRKRNIRRTVIGAAAICTLIALHFWLLSRTTLSFTFSLDGKDLPSGISPVVNVDGKPFVSGDKIGLGCHTINASFPGGEAIEKKAWSFYGNNDLGPLPLEFSKGSLSVTVNPSPANVVVQREGAIVNQGDAPLNIDKLRVGNYTLIIHRGEYEETHSATIQRGLLTKEQIDLNLGGVDLSSVPTNAEFILSAGTRHWQGKLPIRIDDIPGGNYSLAVSRKGWKLDKDILISRGNVTTNKTEFQYGSIEVTSDPPDLAISTNGVEIGKTPLTLQEIIPGQYTLTASDGENDMNASVSVAPKEAVKHSFVFHYGAVQLSSTPIGATVLRKGKEIGRTPLTLAHIPAGETTVELQLQDYVSTNFTFQAAEGVTTSVSVKLISEHYLQAMKQAREAFDSEHLEDSSKFITDALKSEPNDLEAMKLQAEVSKLLAQAEETRKETGRQENEARKEVEQKVELEKNVGYEAEYQQLIASFQDAGMFKHYAKEYSFDFDKAWNAVNDILRQQGEKVTKSNFQNGILLTDLTRHALAVIILPHYDRYVILVERSNSNSTKVNLTLMRFWSEVVNGAVVLRPERYIQGGVVDRQAKDFFDKIAKKLNAP